jgi:GTP cyclohydrolase I
MDQGKRDLHYKNLQTLFKDLGEDPERDGLKKTPARIVAAWEFLTSGYEENPSDTLKGALFDVDYQDMVIVRDIEVYSLCEHHMLPFYGRCHVGYIPRDKVVGLSKLPRVVDIFARRLQVQERLTHQIAETIDRHLKPLGVGVVIEAYHLCMMMRGVGKQNSFTMTSSMHGQFQNLETRTEFLNLIRSTKP